MPGRLPTPSRSPAVPLTYVTHTCPTFPSFVFSTPSSDRERAQARAEPSMATARRGRGREGRREAEAHCCELRDKDHERKEKGRTRERERAPPRNCLYLPRLPCLSSIFLQAAKSATLVILSLTRSEGWSQIVVDFSPWKFCEGRFHRDMGEDVGYHLSRLLSSNPTSYATSEASMTFEN